MPWDRVQIARANAVIERLERLWPQAFSVYERRRKPLAIGIDRALLAACAPAIAKGMISAADIKAALARYVGADGYLFALARPGAERVDLAGKPVGAVAAKDAERARKILAQRRERRAQRKAAAAERMISL